jgi:hypothetical protein
MADLLSKIPLQFEPLRKNRFVFRFPSDLGIQEWFVSAGSLPEIDQNVTEIPFLNTSTYILGRYVWKPINITLRQLIGPSTSQAVMEWIRLSSESVTGRQGYAAGYKRNVEIDMLDPTGVVVSKWIMVNTMTTTANFGQLDYSSSDLATIELGLQYDYAILAY